MGWSRCLWAGVFEGMSGDVYRVVDHVKDVGDKGNPSHRGNENQNHSEISLIPTGLASVKLEGEKKTGLAKVGRNWNPHALLLVGLAADVESSLETPLKAKNRIPI